ncbi:hypothetical protein DK412_08950 [Methylobacterium sp. 17Sr1-1]|nr:hypothetical protein DK412_08950 [Methylobacterium sp. 17Sr1-1]
MSSLIDRARFEKCFALAERGATPGERAAGRAVCDSSTAFWHEASGNWICERRCGIADRAAASVGLNDFVDGIPFRSALGDFL